MTWFRCGGGIAIPNTIWWGTPSEYSALQNKSDDTLYKALYNGIVPSAEFIGTTQITPIGKNFNDYAILVDEYKPTNYTFDTGFEWFSGIDFEVSFSLKNSSYAGTSVLISNSSDQPAFNVILNETNLRIFTTGYNQTIIDTIQANTEYVMRKVGSSITISRGGTTLFSTTDSTQNATHMCLFGWGSNYRMAGPINYVTVKVIT